MAGQEFARGAAELRAARAGQEGLLWSVALFSIASNLLLFTSPLYMMQVYDRVLGSRSEATLAALSVLMAALFLGMGLLDLARGRVLARVGARIQERLDRRVFEASMRRLMVQPDDPAALAAQKDVEALQRFWSSQVVVALIDMPWAPVFFFALFVFDKVLGFAALGGMAIICGIAVLNQLRTKRPQMQATQAGIAADRASELLKTEAEPIRALGMTQAAFDRWQRARGRALEQSIVASDNGGAYAILSRTFRMFLQSAMLGLGALLVLQNEMSSGAMIAGSVLMGRALQPIEQAVAQWGVLQRAREAHARLSDLLTRVPAEPPRTALPRPRAVLDVAGLTVAAPGDAVPILKGVSFALQPGQAVGVIGPSGAGKSTLARALIGLWRISAGRVRLDGATIDQYDPDVLGSYFGYLPQRVTLFDGTVADNIARLQPNPSAEAVVKAAKAAAAHDMILRLPQGYDTPIGTQGARLSGGQIQRIGLARALYGDPVLLILDEPNSNLDNDGSQALNDAIRAHKANGGAALIMAHRPAAIQECDLLLVIEDGLRRAFGPRDAILREMVKNHTDIARTGTQGGVA